MHSRIRDGNLWESQDSILILGVQFDSGLILDSKGILDWMNRKGGTIVSLTPVQCVPKHSLQCNMKHNWQLLTVSSFFFILNS